MDPFSAQLTQLTSFFQKKLWAFFLILVILGLSIRLIFVWGNTIPYMYDHARDSLEIMEMLETKSPLLIGPRASIDGVFFGPGWYYLAAPFYYFGDGHPLSPVGAVLLLFIIELWLTYRYFGKWPALIMTFTSGWWWIATSAWNPFPLAFTALLLLIVLQKTQHTRQLSPKYAVILGFSMGFGFHFSTAYALFYPVMIGLAFWHQRIRFSGFSLMVLLLSFLLPWTPQVVFELRHNFLEVRAILAYAHGSKLLTFSIWRPLQTIGTITATLFQATFPDFSIGNVIFRTVTGGLIFGLLLFTFFKRLLQRVRSAENLVFESWLFILVPTMGYLFLHFSLWYVVGMYPAAVLIVSRQIAQLKKNWQVIIVGMYIISTLISVGRYFSFGRATFLTGHNFLPVKLKALQAVRELAGGQPFASYQFVPEVYDYTYQYLYFWQAEHGWQLPVEFSYQPNATAYYSQKPELLQQFAAKLPPSGTKPVYLFFIVEKPEYQNVLDEWWTHQLPHRVIKKVEISPELTVYQATSL